MTLRISLFAEFERAALSGPERCLSGDVDGLGWAGQWGVGKVLQKGKTKSLSNTFVREWPGSGWGWSGHPYWGLDRDCRHQGLRKEGKKPLPSSTRKTAPCPRKVKVAPPLRELGLRPSENLPFSRYLLSPTVP